MSLTVKSLETAKWWDSAARVAHDVKPGTVVTFHTLEDASYFADGKRGVFALSGSDDDDSSSDVGGEPDTSDAPKPKRSKTK